jgi:hypothetical protein
MLLVDGTAVVTVAMPPVTRTDPQVPLLQTGVLPPQGSCASQWWSVLQREGVSPSQRGAPGLHSKQLPCSHTGLVESHTGLQSIFPASGCGMAGMFASFSGTGADASLADPSIPRPESAFGLGAAASACGISVGVPASTEVGLAASSMSAPASGERLGTAWQTKSAPQVWPEGQACPPLQENGPVDGVMPQPLTASPDRTTPTTTEVRKPRVAGAPQAATGLITCDVVFDWMVRNTNKQIGARQDTQFARRSAQTQHACLLVRGTLHRNGRCARGDARVSVWMPKCGCRSQSSQRRTLRFESSTWLIRSRLWRRSALTLDPWSRYAPRFERGIYTMRRLIAFRFAAVVAVLWLMLPSPTRAEEPASPAAQPSYDELIRRALQEFKLGHWTEARIYFANAHALQPNARTLRGLGLACYEARSYVEAIAFFEQSLANQQQPLTPGMRDECSRLLAQARQFVANAKIELEPANVELLLDSRPIQLGPDASVLLDPGQHEFLARAEGFEPATETVRAEGGDVLSVHLHLKPIVPNAPLAPAQDSPFLQVPVEETVSPATKPPPSKAAELAPWIVIGASGAVAVTGVIFLGVAASDKSAAEHPDAGATWADVQHATKQGRAFFPLGFVLLGTGLAGVAAGCLWKLWPTLTERQVGAANIRLTPGGVVVSGTL